VAQVLAPHTSVRVLLPEIVPKIEAIAPFVSDHLSVGRCRLRPQFAPQSPQGIVDQRLPSFVALFSEERGNLCPMIQKLVSSDALEINPNPGAYIPAQRTGETIPRSLIHCSAHSRLSRHSVVSSSSPSR
jgi:hypothetical protein